MRCSTRKLAKYHLSDTESCNGGDDETVDLFLRLERETTPWEHKIKVQVDQLSDHHGPQSVCHYQPWDIRLQWLP